MVAGQYRIALGKGTEGACRDLSCLVSCWVSLSLAYAWFGMPCQEFYQLLSVGSRSRSPVRGLGFGIVCGGCPKPAHSWYGSWLAWLAWSHQRLVGMVVVVVVVYMLKLMLA